MKVESSSGSEWFMGSPAAYRHILVVADILMALTLLYSLRLLLVSGNSLPLFVRGVFLGQELLADALLIFATSVAFTKYSADERGLTKRPPFGRAVTVGMDSIHSIELRRTMGIVLHGRNHARPVSMKWGIKGDGSEDDMIALLIQLSKGPARAAMDAPLLRLLAAIEEARGYSPEEIAALRPNVARAVRALRRGRFADLHGWLGGARPPEIPRPALEALAVMRELGTVP